MDLGEIHKEKIKYIQEVLYIHTFTAIEMKMFLNQETKPPKTKTTKEETKTKTNPALHLTLSPALSLPQTLTHHFLYNTLKTKSRVLVVMNTKYRDHC